MNDKEEQNDCEYDDNDDVGHLVVFPENGGGG